MRKRRRIKKNGISYEPIGLNKSAYNYYFPHTYTKYVELGTIRVLRNQDFGFSDPSSLPFVITSSTQHARTDLNKRFLPKAMTTTG